ncbi:MAG: nucleoside deaminase [Akkermansiaceae bacterium]|nr:nucleoside deaminase [Akkermansiaceae bacterium]MCP5542343.1 nucleoside deaminase [Akkermansiaceae bacterium]MCP5546121.1 nucleoside deaminase [Akkermansiaceae bacterium]
MTRKISAAGANRRVAARAVRYPSAVDENEAPIIDLRSDAHFMSQALREAHKAFNRGEVPIGAVIVHENRIIARAWNQVETLKDATAHAEMLALTAAQQALGDWRLENCTLYVTKEPCPMCAGAIVHCRPSRVVFGCPDPKGGAAGGWINLLDANPPLNHRCDTLSGVMGEESLRLLQTFFREAREKKKAEKQAGEIIPDT